MINCMGCKDAPYDEPAPTRVTPPMDKWMQAWHGPGLLAPWRHLWHLHGTWHNGTYAIGNSQSEPYENPDTRIIVHGDYCTIATHAAAAAAFTLICVSVKLGYAFICYTAVLGYVQYRAYPPTAHTHAQCVRAPRLRCRV